MAERIFLGNSVSVGTGIKVYFFMKKDYLYANTLPVKNNLNGTAIDNLSSTTNPGLAIEVGIVNDIMFETSRDVAPQFISGNKNAVSYSSGKRLTSGKISFSIFNRDFIDFFINDYLKNRDLKNLVKDSIFDTNRFGTETDISDSYIQEASIEYLDQLPPVDIVLVGSGDSVSSMFSSISDKSGSNSTTAGSLFQIDENFKLDAIFSMRLNNVKFLNDSFGITAGSPLSDQVLDFIVCGSKEPWKEVE